MIMLMIKSLLKLNHKKLTTNNYQLFVFVFVQYQKANNYPRLLVATSLTLPPCYLLYRLYEKLHQLNIFKIKVVKIKNTNITNCDCINWLNYNCLKRKYHTKYLKMTISKMKMKNIINDLYVFRNVSCFMFLILFFCSCIKNVSCF